MHAIERLCPDADPADSPCAQGVHQFWSDCLRVALDRELAAAGFDARCPGCTVESFEQQGPQLRPKEAGGASSDKDGADVRLHEGSQGFEFAEKSASKSFLPVPSVHDAVKVAVMAFMEAEWHMNVERTRRAVWFRGLRKNSPCRTVGPHRQREAYRTRCTSRIRCRVGKARFLIVIHDLTKRTRGCRCGWSLGRVLTWLQRVSGRSKNRNGASVAR